mgnify:FL=1
MIKIKDINLKIKHLLTSEAFKKKPLIMLLRSIVLLLLLLLRINVKYKVRFKETNFIYTFKTYFRSGLGGRGQYIFREFYDPFFSCGEKLFLKKFNFIDIGCSRGFFSMYLLKLKNLKSSGLCIEPLKEAIFDFKEILKLNNIKRVKIINGVISNKSNKKIPLYRVNDKHGYYSVFKNVRFADKKIRKKIYVKSYTIDQLIFKNKRLKSVEFIKIDAEGAEYEILIKSIKTIQKFKPAIYCEVTRKKNEIFNFFRRNHYKLFMPFDEKIIPLEVKNFKGNLLAFSKNSKFSKIFSFDN